MNVLCATRCILFENRWPLLMTAVSVGLGFLMGRYYVGGGGGGVGGSIEKATDCTGTTSTAVSDIVNTDITMTMTDSAALRLSADCWRIILSKIVKLAGDVEDLRELATGIQWQAPANK